MIKLKNVSGGRVLFRSPRLVAVAVLSMLAGLTLTNRANAAVSCNSQQLTAQTGMVSVPSLPREYTYFGQTSVVVDGVDAKLLRHSRKSKVNAGLGGEHVSYVLGGDGSLQGFTWMDVRFQRQKKQLRESATDAIARDFLTCYAPDLLENMKLLWIHEHDESIRTEEGTELTLTGMKFKALDRSTGLYFWVIVGPDRNVMVFERDIRWVTFPGHRGTEKWLHDSWLAEHLSEVAFTFR